MIITFKIDSKTLKTTLSTKTESDDTLDVHKGKLLLLKQLITSIARNEQFTYDVIHYVNNEMIKNTDELTSI